MKRLQTTFIFAFLVAAVLFIVVFLLGGLAFHTILASFFDETVPSFAYMKIPLAAFFILTNLSLIAGLLFGIYTTHLYRKNCLFELQMERGLDRSAFSFLASGLGALLAALYLFLNTGNFLISVFFLFLTCVLFAVSQVLFLLSDVVNRGRKLREENDLTI